MELAAEMQVSPERVGQLFRAFRDGKHPHFAGRFNRFAELTPIQVAILRGEEIEIEVVGFEDVTDTEGTEQGPSKEAAPQGKERKSWFKINLEITRLDVVFYATTGTACAGFITAFQWWGIPVSLVYSLILIDAMGMAKDVELQKTAERGSAAVIVFEMIAGFAHTYVFNTVMWRNYKSLPFEIEQRVSNGVLTWHNGDKPFLIAVCIAVILSGSAVYAVDTTIKKTRERVKNLAK